MALSGVDHVRQLDQRTIPEFVRVVARLRSVLGASSDENASIIGLNGAESNWNIEVYV